MLSTYQNIPQQYARLKELVSDLNQYLQNVENYAELDPNIIAAIVGGENSSQIPSHIEKLPQVQLIKAVRHSIQAIADDFKSDDYSKFFKLVFDLQNFWDVAKSYVLAEETICLSPEFHSKILSLSSIILHSNELIREELNHIKINPQFIFSSSTEFADNDTKKWKYYREKVVTLRQLLPKDNKLKPYVKNLEDLITFIINLKEKGMLKSNLIVSVLDFVEGFKNASRISLKEILQEYATFSEQEIKELLAKINHFWACFLPVCDETEINTGLAMGYLTHRLEPIVTFCNVLESEFNQYYEDGSYPYTDIKLTRIRHGIDQTKILLEKETERKQKLTIFNNLLQDILENHPFTIEQIVPFHRFIELLKCDQSLKKSFHDFVDKEVSAISEQIAPQQKSLLEFTRLYNKYKLHEATIEEAQQLFVELEGQTNGAEAKEYHDEIVNEYKTFSQNIKEALEKIETGKLQDKDIKHALIMINILEPLSADASAKSELVKLAVNKRMQHVEKLQELLDLFADNRLPEQDFYQLLDHIDFLDCDASIKRKYKKQITDLDYKRKNTGYLRLAVDFALGFFAEVTVPFSEIRSITRNQITNLQAIAEEDFKPKSNAAVPERSSILKFTDKIFKPIARAGNRIEWLRLKERVEVELRENVNKVEVVQGLAAYQEARYKQLETSLNGFKPPTKVVDEVQAPKPAEPFSFKGFLTNLAKKVIATTTDVIYSIYKSVKSTYNYVKSFFLPKPSTDIDDLVFIRKDTPADAKPKLPASGTYPYRELEFVEENLALFLEKLVNPIYLKPLQDALTKHQTIDLNEQMPYFYRQAASIVNVFILFRKVVLSYSHWDMLQLSLAASNLNTENKIILDGILQSGMLTESSIFYSKIIKPTLASSYQIAADLEIDQVNLEKSFPQVAHRIHTGLDSIAKNQPLDLKPFLEFLNRVGANLQKSDKPLDEDVTKLYASINKLAGFVEKALNKQENFLVEALFSLADLLHEFRQLSSSVTRLLLKDEFPYLKELGVSMKMLQDILLLLQDNLAQLKDTGLHPTIINSLTKSVAAAKNFVSQLTPLKFQQERILLEIAQIKPNLLKLGPDRVFQHELDNIQQLLTTAADQKFINEKVLSDIEIRLQEIKTKVRESHAHRWVGFFSQRVPFLQPKTEEPQEAYSNQASNKR